MRNAENNARLDRITVRRALYAAIVITIYLTSLSVEKN